MASKAKRKERRLETLSREQIVEAAISILDSVGEAGLTFRTLSEKLTTGPGALYAYIEDKDDLMAAACDSIVAGITERPHLGPSPQANLRALALGVFDALEKHPWVGSTLMRPQMRSPSVRLLEQVGQQVRTMGVPKQAQWSAVGTLMSYILGVGGQNAANGSLARERGLEREPFLQAIAESWLELDRSQYPFVHSIARSFPSHDDSRDFLAGIDLILKGIGVPKPDLR